MDSGFLESFILQTYMLIFKLRGLDLRRVVAVGWRRSIGGKRFCIAWFGATKGVWGWDKLKGCVLNRKVNPNSNALDFDFSMSLSLQSECATKLPYNTTTRPLVERPSITEVQVALPLLLNSAPSPTQLHKPQPPHIIICLIAQQNDSSRHRDIGRLQINRGQ